MSNEGALLQDDDGALVMLAEDDEGALAMGEDGDDCCDDCAIRPPPLDCADKATCNDYCTGEAVYERGECCDCPCPDRKDYPQCFTIDVEGFTIVDFFDAEDGTPHYWTFDPTGPFSFEDVGCTRKQSDWITVNEYQFDVLISTATLRIACQGGDGRAIAGCPDEGKIPVNVVVLIGDTAGPGEFHLPGSDILATTVQDDLLGSAHVGNACTGGDGSLYRNSFTNICNSPGSFTVTPTCEDCLGHTGCARSTGDPPAVCGQSIDVQFEHDTGTVDEMNNEIWEFISGTATQSSKCAWGGGFTNASVSIYTVPTTPGGSPCCPPCDCEDCDGDCPPGTSCRASCWQLDLAVGPDAESFYLGACSCPCHGTFINGTKFRSLILSSQTGCR